MIEMHDPADTGEDPYVEPLDYTSRILLKHNADIVTLLRSMEENLERLSNYMPQQLSKLRPTLIDLGPLSGKSGAGTAAGAVWQTTQRFRITNIITGGAAGDNLRLSLGLVKYNFFNLNGALMYSPFEIEVDRGIDISLADITTPASQAFTFMLQGYAE